MNFLRKIFNRKCHREPETTPPKALRIEGCSTVLTPEPDDAELAAQALLESLAGGREQDGKQDAKAGRQTVKGSAAYYHRLADRIRESRIAQARMAMRYVAYCEEQLDKIKKVKTESHAPSLNELEQGLYRQLDIVEREGGELLRRWRHCLAECIVRQTDTGDGSGQETTTD